MKRCQRRGAMVVVLLTAAAVVVTTSPLHAAMELIRTQDAKHTPVITAPAKVNAGEPFEVTITVGEKMHPSKADHMIQWIALYADEVLLAHVTLSPVVTIPVVTVTVSLQESVTLRALSQPNHSAPWEASRKITVIKASAPQE